MTIAELKQYRSLCAEIKDLEDELKGSYVGDSVTSASGFPYSKHTVHIEGYKSSGGTVAMLVRLSELKAQRDDILDFIDKVFGIDKEMNYILRQKYINGKTNLYIAKRLGYSDEGTIRKKVKNFFKLSDFSDFRVI